MANNFYHQFCWPVVCVTIWVLYECVYFISFSKCTNQCITVQLPFHQFCIISNDLLPLSCWVLHAILCEHVVCGNWGAGQWQACRDGREWGGGRFTWGMWVGEWEQAHLVCSTRVDNYILCISAIWHWGLFGPWGPHYAALYKLSFSLGGAEKAHRSCTQLNPLSPCHLHIVKTAVVILICLLASESTF